MKAPKFLKYLFFFLAFLSSSLWFLYFSSPPKNFSVNFFDVGSGDAILLRTPDNFKILIDGGPSSRVLEYLGKNLGPFDRKIDLLVLSHPHQDHMFGSAEILKKYDVGMVLGTGILYTSSAYLEVLGKIKNQNINFIVAEQGKILKFGDLELQIFYPFESLVGKKMDNVNNSSVIFRAKYKKVSFLFLGDAEQEAGERLLKTNFHLRSDVLKISHQGSRNAAQNVPGFLEKVSPILAVISVGENKFGHPHKETLDNLSKNNIKVLRTDEKGTITIESDGEKFWVK